MDALMCINHQFGGLTTSFVDACPEALVGEVVASSVRLALGVGDPPVQALLRGELRTLQVLRWGVKQY